MKFLASKQIAGSFHFKACHIMVFIDLQKIRIHLIANPFFSKPASFKEPAARWRVYRGRNFPPSILSFPI